jgi:hypothetical protein
MDFYHPLRAQDNLKSGKGRWRRCVRVF